MFTSPEQLKQDPKLLDVSTDVFQLGVTLYSLMSDIEGRNYFFNPQTASDNTFVSKRAPEATLRSTHTLPEGCNVLQILRQMTEYEKKDIVSLEHVHQQLVQAFEKDVEAGFYAEDQGQNLTSPLFSDEYFKDGYEEEPLPIVVSPPIMGGSRSENRKKDEMGIYTAARWTKPYQTSAIPVPLIRAYL